MFHCKFTTESYPDTAQEILDGAREHLLAQGHKSTSEDGDTCYYRGDADAACGAGFLIPDGLYEPGMEGCDWREVTGSCPALAEMYGIHENLIGRIQMAHDESDDILQEGETFAESITFSLRRIAESSGLEA